MTLEKPIEMNNDDYHGKGLPDHFSSSKLKKFYRKSGAHMIAEKKSFVESDAMKFGTAFHALILEPDTFDETYITMPEFEPTEIVKKTGLVREKTGGWKNTNDYKGQRDDFYRINAGRVILTEEDYEILKEMEKSLQANPLYRKYFCEKGYNEATYTGTYMDEKVKVRADRITEIDGYTVVIDLKTTADASKMDFNKTIYRMDYDLSAALYTDIMKAVEFIWVACEKVAPYSCCFYRMSQDKYQTGQIKLKTAISNLVEQRPPFGEDYLGYEAEYKVVEI